MEIQLTTDDSIRLTSHEPGVAIEPAEDVSLSPFHLLAASLATCTYSVVYTWALNAGVPLEELAIDVEWEFGDEPYRVTRMAMALDWPALPADRREAARRVAARCTVHHTLEHGSQVETTVRPADDDASGP